MSGLFPQPLIQGPVLLGFAFNWALQGILTVQVYIFYLCFPQDPAVRKCAVYALCLFEWAQTILITTDTFNHFVFENGTIEGLFLWDGNGWLSVLVMPAVTAVAVQTFFAWRIFILSRSRLLTSIILAIAVTQLCAGAVAAVGMKNSGSGLLSSAHIYSMALNDATLVWLSGNVIVDVLIAAFMTYTLHKFKTTHKQTNVLVNRLIKLVIETGSLTAIAEIVTTVFWVVYTSTGLAACPLFVLSKLYANSLMITFNNRAFMHQEDTSIDSHISPLAIQMTARETGLVQASIRASVDARRPIDVVISPTTGSIGEDLEK